MTYTPPLPIPKESEFLVRLSGSSTDAVNFHHVASDGRRRPRGRTTTLLYTNADRTQQEFTFAPGGSFLHGFSVFARGAIKRGELYCQVALNKGAPMLAQGYVYNGYDLMDGDFKEPGPGGGEGFLRSVSGTDPAAGAEISETVPDNARWRLHMIRFDCAVGAANFRSRLTITDGSNEVFNTLIGVLTSGGTEQITGYIGTGDTEDDAAGNITFPLPADLVLEEGWVIATAGISGDDNYTAPQLTVEEWLTI